VYVKGAINYGELPVGVEYRQVGLYNGLIPVVGSDTAVVPSGVLNEGRFIYYSNNTPTLRDISKKDILELVLEIR
jgi:hypothetical protein